VGVYAPACSQAPLTLDEIKGYRFDLVKPRLLREAADMLVISSVYLIMRGLELAQYDAHRQPEARRPQCAIQRSAASVQWAVLDGHEPTLVTGSFAEVHSVILEPRRRQRQAPVVGVMVPRTLRASAPDRGCGPGSPAAAVRRWRRLVDHRAAALR
jgi:hypothetical protein